MMPAVTGVAHLFVYVRDLEEVVVLGFVPLIQPSCAELFDQLSSTAAVPLCTHVGFLFVLLTCPAACGGCAANCSAPLTCLISAGRQRGPSVARCERLVFRKLLLIIVFRNFPSYCVQPRLVSWWLAFFHLRPALSPAVHFRPCSPAHGYYVSILISGLLPATVA